MLQDVLRTWFNSAPSRHEYATHCISIINLARDIMCVCSPLQVHTQHNPETGEVEEKEFSSRDQLSAPGTPVVEVDWNHSRARGQLHSSQLAEAFAAEDIVNRL